MTDTKSLTLNGIKREKNFIAVLDKGYSRYVNEDYPISDRGGSFTLIGFVKREVEELETEIKILEAHLRNRERLGDKSPVSDEMVREQVHKAMMEVGDVSNTLDYLFDALDAMDRSGGFALFRGEK